MRLQFAVIALATAPAYAQSEDLADPIVMTRNITEISAMLASEQICGLAYKQDRVAEWIDAKTPPEAAVFASQLSLITEGSKITFSEQSESERTAHCAAITKTAKHLGFTD